MGITLYTASESTGALPKFKFLDEPIVFIKHDRNPSRNHATVADYLESLPNEKVPKGINPVTKKKFKAWTYNHYCPYQRIYNAIAEHILSDIPKTRQYVADWLLGDLTWSKIDFTDIVGIPKSTSTSVAKTVPCVVTKLNIVPTEKDLLLLRAAGHPFYTVLAFDIWVEWAINQVLDWPQNMFYGKGYGDFAGTQLDIPRKPENVAAAQKARVEASLKELQKHIPGLSADQTVSVNKYDKIYTHVGQKALGALANVSIQDQNLLQQRAQIMDVLQEKIQEQLEYNSKKRKYDNVIQYPNANQFALDDVDAEEILDGDDTMPQ